MEFEELKRRLLLPVSVLKDLDQSIQNTLKASNIKFIAHIHAYGEQDLLLMSGFKTVRLHKLGRSLKNIDVPLGSVKFDDPKKMTDATYEELKAYLAPATVRMRLPDTEGVWLEDLMPHGVDLSEEFRASVLTDEAVTNKVRQILREAIEGRQGPTVFPG